MKYVLIFAGLILILAAIYSAKPFILDYSTLTEFGKGYIWGNVLLFVTGFALLVWGLRKWKRKSGS